MTAPAPSPAEQAVIERFGIFAEERVVEEVARAKRDLDRLRDLDQQCREASEDANRQQAGMREVALFRAANAKAVMGGYAVGLAERLVAALEEVAAAVAAYRATQDGGAEEAVRRVEALHVPFGIYTECECDHTEDDIENDLAFEVMEVGITCEDGLMYRVCLSCCTGNGYQTEECVTNHEHGKDEPICPTVAALAPQADA